ncbi:CHRD domain-containing protein [Brumimicrobium glaciale]|uniref:CHRD domain-containing protein n=2 Tax=Brumimicrobium glaciale TaxID=200475 RepID=A0A4Q4KKH4_9FLAO|nr:CHRD domain-containing protein [Brumimicrobium glaciale]
MMKNLQKIAIAAVLTLSTSAMSFAAHLGDQLTFSARMNGQQEVPAVTTTGQGVATMVLNGTRDTLCISIYTAGSPTMLNGIHLHSGAAGTNGAVVVDLSPFLVNGNVKTVITGAALTSALISDMITGDIYVNAHTDANPNGEIRGQVKLESDFPYRAELNGLNEVPLVVTAASGLGVFNLSLDKKKLMYWITADGLSGTIGGAHLHVGAAGSNGAVVVDLSPSIMGNSIIGVADVSAIPGFVANLEADDIYVNIHTAANPNGEIRAQLNYDNQVAFDGALSGMQEVPAVTTNATGVAQFSLNSDFTSIDYSVQVEGLSGAIMGAHLHNEAAGANGPVVVDLSGDVTGNRISGTISGAALTQSLIIELLESNIYLNVHTAANPNGEIRAQINRVAREGYSVNLSGDQEVPGVSTPASGGGIITISRERNNAHVMLVAKDLSGPITASHIHNAAAGMNGGVEFDLSGLFAGTNSYDGAYGYLTADDASPMNAAAETKFRNNEMYVNVHTADNPNGEVRGQVMRGSECMQVTLGLDDSNVIEENNLTAYPNPTSDIITLSFEKFEGEMTVQLVDIFGKIIQTKSVNANNTTIDMSKLPSGVYMLKAGSQITRVIKK